MMNRLSAMLALLAAYFLALKLASGLAGPLPALHGVVWLPAGVGALACMIFGWRIMPLLLLVRTAFVYPDLVEASAWEAMIHALISLGLDLLQLVMVWRICRSDLSSGLNHIGDVLGLILLVGLMPGALIGFGHALNIANAANLSWRMIQDTTASIAVADSFGIVMTLPAYWAWQAEGRRNEAGLTGLYCLAVGATLYLSWAVLPALIALAIPLLAGLAIQTGLRGLVIGQLLLFVSLLVAWNGGAEFLPTGMVSPTVADQRLILGSLMMAMLLISIYRSRMSIDLKQLEGLYQQSVEAFQVEIEQRRALEQQLEHRAHYDDLTGLPNRPLFFDRLHQTIVRARREGARFALLFIDLDGFKEINDGLGHDAGDDLLVRVSKRLSACVRESDTVARVGGDEFTVIVGEISFRRHALIVADKVLDAVAEPFALGGQECRIGASIGIAIYPDDGEDAETILNCADSAMYAIKRQGKNDRTFYSSEMGFPQLSAL